jgi:hypothetical protein
MLALHREHAKRGLQSAAWALSAAAAAVAAAVAAAAGALTWRRGGTGGSWRVRCSTVHAA